jgi:cbb3-type cytochrome oxidase maturation protein
MALGLGLAGLFAFLWSLRSGQYDDLDGAALRILGDEDLKREKAGTPETAQIAAFTRRPSER